MQLLHGTGYVARRFSLALKSTSAKAVFSAQAIGNASKLGGDPNRYFTIGQSAGGNLALATAHLLIEQGRRSEIKGVAALVPLTVHHENVPPHHTDSHRSHQECADGPVNTAHAMATFLGMSL
jgi:versiconal hemiacetal acetate esterase